MGIMHRYVAWNSAGQQIEQKFLFKFAFRKSLEDGVGVTKRWVNVIQHLLITAIHGPTELHTEYYRQYVQLWSESP